MLFRFLFLVISLIASSAFAADVNPPIDAGTLQRTLPPQEVEVPQNFDPKTRINDDQFNRPGSGVTVEIKQFKITGNKLITTQEIVSELSMYLNKTVGMAELEKIAQAVGELYRKKGYWARAYLPDQDVKNGEIWIDVLEAKLGSIRIETNEENLRFSKDRAVSFIEKGQKSGDPLKILKLEKAIRDLDNVSGITAAVVLDRGKKEGETDVVVKMANTPYVTGSLRGDNHGSRATGYGRGVLYLTLDSPFKRGEQFNLQYVKTDEMDFYSLGASYPLRDDGTEASLMYTNMDYSLGFPLKDLMATGKSESYTASLSRPLWGGFNSDLKGSLSFTHKKYFNSALDTTTSDKNIDGATLSAVLNRTDELFGGGMSIGSLSYVSGQLDLSNLVSDLEADKLSAKRQGHFSKVGLSFTRIQQLTPKNMLWFTVNGQYAFDNLDSAEKISLGGPTAVRAYPVAEANGDHGLIINAELRHQLTPKLQATAFYDWGQITLNHETWTDWNSSDTSIKNRYVLKGAGVGFRLNFLDGYELVGNVAQRIGKNPGASATDDDADGTHHIIRSWFTLTKVF